MSRLPLAVVALLVSASAFAHHGWSDYEADKPMTLKGTVQTSSYENPHASIRLVADGKTYEVVLAPVSRMEARGASRAAIAVGQVVTVVAYPSKSHPTELRAERIVVTEAGTEKSVELR